MEITTLYICLIMLPCCKPVIWSRDWKSNWINVVVNIFQGWIYIPSRLKIPGKIIRFRENFIWENIIKKSLEHFWKKNSPLKYWKLRNFFTPECPTLTIYILATEWWYYSFTQYLLIHFLMVPFVCIRYSKIAKSDMSSFQIWSNSRR